MNSWRKNTLADLADLADFFKIFEIILIYGNKIREFVAKKPETRKTSNLKQKHYVT